MKIVPMSAQLIDHMGSDLSVVNAARVSFHKESDWELIGPHGGPPVQSFLHPEMNTKGLKAADAKLLAYLAEHGHWSPFAHTSLQFRIKAPMFVARQMVKHQVGGVWNEVSRRYVDDEPEFFAPSKWRGRPENAKQGSTGWLPDEVWVGETNWHLCEVAESSMRGALEAYNRLLECGVAPEMARMVLPLNTMTEWIWTGSLYFFARCCRERMNPHAQKECGDLARMFYPQCAKEFPVSWAALMKGRIE